MKCIRAYGKSRQICTSLTERAEYNKLWLDFRTEETNEGIQRKEGTLVRGGEKTDKTTMKMFLQKSFIFRMFLLVCHKQGERWLLKKELHLGCAYVNGKEQGALKSVT